MSDLTETTAEKLQQVVERIERLESDKAEIGEQVKETYQEAKAFGFDTKAIRAIIKLRKMDRAEREELESIVETYMKAIGE